MVITAPSGVDDAFSNSRSSSKNVIIYLQLRVYLNNY